ncbi:MAG TPA: FMN-binding negative transcriptional regulator [Chitinophagaceae bacterium]|nr:FMN-binding negative transcriptional regulator [Chitinophagaceae bacterium]
MYNLPYFKEDDAEVVVQFMRDHPFVFLSGVSEEQKPVATQVPVFIDERDGKLFLTGHIMRNTDHHKAFVKNPNVLAVFTGPHVYVSGTWYSDPHQASTWNYMSVHAKGTLQFGNYDDLVAILKRLTLHYENNNSASTTVFDNLSSGYIASLIKAIIAFEVEIISVENVFKLSQNRDEKSFNNIISKLEELGSDGQFIAKEMKKREQKLFGK